jgi:protein associated with RNAse G/E
MTRVRPSSYVIEKRKYNSVLWGHYAVFALQQTPARHAFWQPRGTYIHRNQGWAMRRDHLQFFYPNRWYAISANYDEHGDLSHCYCDVTLPWVAPAAGAHAFQFIDLELDLHAEPSTAFRIYDEDEFAAAVVDMAYPPEIRQGARDALDELIQAVRRWDSPFAEIPMVLPRADLHLLEVNSSTWRQALGALGMR